MRYARWLALLGDWAYDCALRLNTLFNVARRRLGYPYWSLSAYLKSRSRTRSSSSATMRARSPARRGSASVDGVVCGHIHHAEIRDIDGMLYCNDGDWVESCTALVEHFDGWLEIIHWIELRARSHSTHAKRRRELELTDEDA